MNLDFTDLTEFLPAHPKQKEALSRLKKKKEEVKKGIKELVDFKPSVQPTVSTIDLRKQIRKHLEEFNVRKKTLEKVKSFKIYLQETETFTLIELTSSFFESGTDEYQEVTKYMEHFEKNKIKDKQAYEPPIDCTTQTLQPIAVDKNICTSEITYKDQFCQASVWDIEDSYNALDNIKEEQDEEGQFLGAAQILQRILASTNYHRQQMMFHTKLVPSTGIGKFTITKLWTFKDTCGLPVLGVSWSTKSEKILAAGYGDRDRNGGVVCIWNVKNPHTPERRIRTKSNVNCLAFANTRSEILAYACLDGSVLYTDITSHLPQSTEVREQQHGNWPIWGLTWFIHEEIGEVSEKLLTSDDVGQIFLWDLKDKTCKKLEELTFIPTPNKYTNFKNVDKNFVFKENYLPVYWVTVHPLDTRTYYAGTFSGAIATCKTLGLCGKRKLWKAHNGAVLGMKFSPFTHLVFLTYGLDGYLNIWVDGIDEPVHQISHLPHYVIGGEWSPTHSTVLFSLTHEELRVWSLTKSDGKHNASVKYERFTCLQISKNGTNIAAGCEDGNILIYKLSDLPCPHLRQWRLVAQIIGEAQNREIIKQRKFTSGSATQPSVTHEPKCPLVALSMPNAFPRLIQDECLYF